MGYRAGRALWPQDLATEPVELEVVRFEQCSAQPDRCTPPPSGADFAPDELFVDDTEPRQLTLDPDGFSVLVSEMGQLLRGSSTDLADLITEVDQAFASTFADPLANGASPESILADTLADPTGGFLPSEQVWPEFPGYHAFVSANGPVIFFQYISGYLQGLPSYQRGSDALWLYGAEIVDGQTTLHTGSWYVP